MSEKVLEHCNYCGELHEQYNPPLSIGGMVVKSCPKLKQDEMFYPGDWKAKLKEMSEKIIDNNY